MFCWAWAKVIGSWFCCCCCCLLYFCFKTRARLFPRRAKEIWCYSLQNFRWPRDQVSTVEEGNSIMAKQPCIFVVFSTWLLFVLCAHLTYGNFFSSLRFTRESLMQFSRGTQRTVEILTPKKTITKTVTKTINKAATLPKRKDYFGFDGPPLGFKARPKIQMTETVTYQKKRKIYRQRSSPSNKFLEILNVIERAVANANASGDENDAGTLSKLEDLVVKAVQSKRFHYGRQVSRFIVLIMAYMSHFDTKQSGFAQYNFFYMIKTLLGAKCPLTLPSDCRTQFDG